MKQSSVGRRMIIGILIGSAVSLVIAGAGTALVCTLVLNNKIPESAVHLAVLAVHFIAAMTGAYVGTIYANTKKLIVSLLTGSFYYLCLLSANALMLDGQYSGAGVGAITVLLGAMLIGLLNTKRKAHRGHRIKKYRFG